MVCPSLRHPPRRPHPLPPPSSFASNAFSIAFLKVMFGNKHRVGHIRDTVKGGLAALPLVNHFFSISRRSYETVSIRRYHKGQS